MSQLPRRLRLAATLSLLTALAPPALAQLTLYAQESYGGNAQTLQDGSPNLARSGPRQPAFSAMVRGERWEVCEGRRYSGRCQVLREGRYPSLDSMALDEPIRSARPVAAEQRIHEDRYAPLPPVVYDERRRDGERLYEARVISVLAVLGPPEQRCWIERGEVREPPERRANVPGALAGALIGGIIGHQIGGGSGRDIATAGGVVAGAVIGSNVQRDQRGRQIVTQDVRRCSSVADSATPEYWDVRYEFRGIEHRIQTRVPPGETLTVNRRGEPRV